MGRFDTAASAAHARLTVKNTFLDLDVGGDESPLGPGGVGLLRMRASSDPGLYETRCALGAKTEENLPMGEDIFMCGFSDAETDEEEKPQASQLLVGSSDASSASRFFMEACERSSDASSANGDVANSNDIPQAEMSGSVNPAGGASPSAAWEFPASLHQFFEEVKADNGSVSSARCSSVSTDVGEQVQPELKTQVDLLAQENARLAEENRLLVESCRQANTAAAFAQCAAYCAPPSVNLSALPPMAGNASMSMNPTWWGRSMSCPSDNAGVQPQMMCFAVPMPIMAQQQQHDQRSQRQQQRDPFSRQQSAPSAPAAQVQDQWKQKLRPQQSQKTGQGWHAAKVALFEACEPNSAYHANCKEDFDASSASVPSDADAQKGARTTVMLRNLPNNYSRKMLIEMIDTEGFVGRYDFVYLPMDFNTRACLGYAFINLLNTTIAREFWNKFNGFSRWVIPSRKLCGVSWSNPHQGLQSNIDRYRNSPVMHEAVPVDYKPMLLVNGLPALFPPPTKKIRVPRIRNCGVNGVAANPGNQGHAFPDRHDDRC